MAASIFRSPLDMSSSGSEDDSGESLSMPSDCGEGSENGNEQPALEQERSAWSTDSSDLNEKASAAEEVANAERPSVPNTFGVNEINNPRSGPTAPVTESQLDTMLGFNNPRAELHLQLMSAALLEFYCQTRAMEILNSEPGCAGRFNRDSPEIQAFSSAMFKECAHRLPANQARVESDMFAGVRQLYLQGLETIALPGVEVPNASPPMGGGTVNHALLPSIAGGQFDPDRPGSTSSESIVALARRRTGDLATLGMTMPISIPIGRQLSGPQVGITTATSSQLSVQKFAEIIAPCRYATEFHEVKKLGKGAFGAVFHASHHLDGQSYAVKQIGLSQKRLDKLSADGLGGLKNLLTEIRTLARLDHVNVVRYYGAWLEPAALVNKEPVGHSKQKLLTSSSSQEKESDRPKDNSQGDSMSFGEIFVGYERSREGSRVVKSDGSFHDVHPSPSDEPQAKPPSALGESSTGPIAIHPGGSAADKGKGKAIPSKSPETDDEVESIPRSLPFTMNRMALSETSSSDAESNYAYDTADIFTDGLGGTKGAGDAGRGARATADPPVLTLHIQMSLHPISLAAYLNPPLTNDKEPSPRHCYHLCRSLKIVLGLLDGVEYLHSEGIIHRDLKPANVFLSESKPSAKVCPSCEGPMNGPNPFANPRIGDFGLVADLSGVGEGAMSNAQASSSSPLSVSPISFKPVGTEFYRPPMVKSQMLLPASNEPGVDEPDVFPGIIHHIDEKLDVFALGVILFEVLYKLETKMERAIVLADLTRTPRDVYGRAEKTCPTHTIIPDDFERKVDCGGLVIGGKVKDDTVSGEGEHGSGEATVGRTLSSCIRGMVDLDPQTRWTCQAVRECLEEVMLAAGGKT